MLVSNHHRRRESVGARAYALVNERGTHLRTERLPLRKLTTPEQKIKLEKTVKRHAMPIRYLEPSLFKLRN